jgi:hypothetical protein
MCKMLISVLQFVFLLTSTGFSVTTALSSNSFSWRGNFLWLKDTVTATGTSAPFKLDTSEASIDIAEDFTGVKSSGQYPLLPDSKCLVPGQFQLVFANEMKFRELMYDCKTSFSSELIRCYVDESGGIEKIGVLCRITDLKNLEDGQAIYTIEGMHKILIEDMSVKPGKSYLTSSKSSKVTTVDDLTAEEIERNEILAIETFKYLKKFLRLSKIRFTALNEIEDLHKVCLTPEAIEHRPAQDDYLSSTPSQKTDRHYKFSNAVVSLFVLPSIDPYSLLTASIFDRLAELNDRLIAGTLNFKSEFADISRAKSSWDLVEQVLELEANQDDNTYLDLAPRPFTAATAEGDGWDSMPDVMQ